MRCIEPRVTFEGHFGDPLYNFLVTLNIFGHWRRQDVMVGGAKVRGSGDEVPRSRSVFINLRGNFGLFLTMI